MYMGHHKDGFNIKAEWYSLTSHRKEPCDDTRGIIKSPSQGPATSILCRTRYWQSTVCINGHKV